MAQLTPRDDVRKAASEILKRVDQLIKGGEIERSVREIMHAKEIDPTNVYIRAYEERLAFLKEEHEKNAERERTRKEAEEAARRRDAELRKRQQEEQQRHTEELARQEAERKKREEQARIEQERARAAQAREPAPAPAPARVADAERLYADAFRKAWSGGNIAPNQAIELQRLRVDLGIASERQLQIDSQILSEIQSKPSADSILVIDDDKEMLLAISQMLSFHGYHVTSVTTSDEAYEMLKRWKPRLILSDINLETSTMGGFGLYEKVREMKNLIDVPFIFLTGLSDEALVRTGKELGADDYLTKPISEENLIAAVKGKLKRFATLREKK